MTGMRKKHKILSWMVAMALIISILPMSTFAELGALEVPAEINYLQTTLESDMALWKSTPKGTYHILYNDFLTFILRPNGMISTIPTRDLPGDAYATMKAGTFDQMAASYLRQIPVTQQVTLYGAPNPPQETAELAFDYKSDTADSTKKVGDNKLQAVYKIDAKESGKKATVTVTYEIVRLDRGITEGERWDDIVGFNPYDDGRTWGIRASARANYNGNNIGNFTMVTDHIGFATSRTDNSQGAIQYSKKGYSYYESLDAMLRQYTSHFWNSNTELPIRSFNAGEFFTSSFSTANQFVATEKFGATISGSEEGIEIEEWTEGHGEYLEGYGWIGANYGTQVSYSPNESFLDFNGTPVSYNNELRVYSNIQYTAEEKGKDSHWTMDGLWGYRDLYAAEDENAPEHVNNFEEVKQGGYLAIGKNNAGDTYAIDGTSIEQLKNTHGENLLAVIRGDWTKHYEGDELFYVFSGKVGLSPTVTATPLDGGGMFIISENGRMSMHNYGFSCPSFQFYTPKAALIGNLFDFENSKSGVLNMVFDPENNESVLHLDIPGAKSIMSGAEIGLDGSLTFKGEMSIYTPVLEIAELNVDKIGMGYKGDTYTVNGIKASGGVKMDVLLGMPSNSVKANINTFNGEEKYEFELNVEVPGLFETEAELTLVRLDNGALAPDDLSLFVGGNTGFPLVAPVVVAEITGAGGGFSDLADTINGDFFAAPPLKLSLTGKAEVLQMLSGKATMTVGLGYYEKKLHDPEFFNLLGLDAEYKESTYFTGDRRNYKSMTFTGVAVGGSKRLEVHLPNEDVDIINISSGLSIDVFAGIAESGDDKFVMLDLDGDGKIDGSLNFPKKIGNLKMPSKIAGKSISSTKLELALGLKTVFNLNKDIEDIIWDGVKNASGKATVSYSKEIFGCELYVTAIFAKKNIKIGVDTWLGDIDTSFSWGKAKNAKLMSYGETDDMYYAMYLSSGIESLGSTENMQLMGINMDDELVNQLAEAGITITQSGEGENSYTLVISDSAKTDRLLFTLTPKAAANDEALEEMFTITKDESDYALIFDDYDEEGNSNVYNANAYVSAGGYDEASGEETNAGVVAQLLEAGTYIISAGEAFDIEVLGFDIAEHIDSGGNVKELKGDGRNYVIRNYLMDSEGEYHMIGEEIEAVNDYDVTSVNISAEQDSVPSGTYTVVYRLLEKMTIPAEESESGEEEDYYVTLDTYEGDEIEVTNPNEVPAPTDIEATSVGSEILRASWTAPANSEDIDGYSVTIYEQNGDEWVNTSTGYEVRADESGTIPTGIDMALTIGGNGDVDGDGTPDVENAVLQADKTYRISVASLSDIKADFDGDGEDETVAKRSAEAFSDENGVFIPKATPPELTYSPEPVTVEGSNMKIMYVKSGRKFNIRSEVGADITVTRTDTNEIIGNDIQNIDVTVPEFEGSLIIQIDVVDVVGDRSRDYIALKKDEIAPVITFDGDSFVADENGHFTITGVTEPGAEFNLDPRDIKMTVIDEENYIFERHYNITQSDDGSFTITGELAEHTKSMDDSAGGALIYMNVTDNAGNMSDNVFAVVTYAKDDLSSQEPPASSSPSGGGGGGVSQYTVKFETNGGTAIANKNVTRNSKLAEPEAPARDGYTFNGWYTDEELTEKYDFNKAVTKGFTLYAKWEKADITVGDWINPFEDVNENDWFFEDVKYANRNTLMQGTSNTTFAPNDNLTRAMLVTVLYRLEGEPEMKDAQWFEDVEKGQWYSDAVSWATFNGITMGYGDGSFGPEDFITREQIAAVMHRYAQYKGYDVSVGENTNILSYDDFADISEYAIAPMQYAAGAGLMKGKSESTLNPGEFATRAEIAAILHRFIEANK